jgi:uncharacterized protein YecE (DUF72 family)
MHDIYVGTTGWSFPRSMSYCILGTGSNLSRYSRVFDAVEVRSSFRPQPSAETFAAWADAVADNFRFSVAVPEAILHSAWDDEAHTALAMFLSALAGLGEKLGVLLLQFPRSPGFDRQRAGAFMEALRSLHLGAVACDPRHPSWFSHEARTLLAEHDVAMVATDPPHRDCPVEKLTASGAIGYMRLRGGPRPASWTCSPERLSSLSAELSALSRQVPVWCIFDSIANGAAIANALDLLSRLR